MSQSCEIVPCLRLLACCLAGRCALFHAYLIIRFPSPFPPLNRQRACSHCGAADSAFCICHHRKQTEGVTLCLEGVGSIEEILPRSASVSNITLSPIDASNSCGQILFSASEWYQNIRNAKLRAIDGALLPAQPPPPPPPPPHLFI